MTAFNIVVVDFRCLPVALALMPDEGFDLVALLALGQLLVYAGSNVLGESFQQRASAHRRRSCRVEESCRCTPIHIVGALSPQVNGGTAKALLDDIKVAVQALLQPEVCHGIIGPPPRHVLVEDPRTEEFKLPVAAMGPAAIAPIAMLIRSLLDVGGKLTVGYTPVGVGLSRHQIDGNGISCCPGKS